MNFQNIDIVKILFVVIIIIFICNINKSNKYINKNDFKKIILKQDEILIKLNKKFNEKMMSDIKSKSKQVEYMDKLSKSTKKQNKSSKSTKKQNKSSKSIKSINSNLNKTNSNPNLNKTNSNQYDNLMLLPPASSGAMSLPQYNSNNNQTTMTDPVYIRDNQVLNDRLYPPLGRTERPQFDLLMNFINKQPGMFNMYTRGPPDTFRPIGYLTPKEGNQNMDNTLMLFGRAKYPNSDIGEFYVTSTNKLSDMKVPLTNNNTNIKKITDVPDNVNIQGNLLSGEYNYTELPKADLTYPYV